MVHVMHKVVWLRHLASKGSFAMAEFILGNLTGYRNGGRWRDDDLDGLRSAIEAVIELTTAATRRMISSNPCEQAVRACQMLIDAYADGSKNGGSVEWEHLDTAHAAACEALGLSPPPDPLPPPVQRLLAMSDDEIIAQAEAEGIDIDAVATKARAILARAIERATAAAQEADIDLMTHEHDNATRYKLYDARGIYCCVVCAICNRQQRQRFRAEIFTDPDYKTVEWVDEDFD